jgi:ABC-type uncharacterized transport system permease subunit
MADDTPVSGIKARSNVFTAMLLVSMLAYLAGIALAFMEMQDTAHFGHQVAGELEYPHGSGK